MYSASFYYFYIRYGRLADILTSKTSKRSFKVGLFYMYPENTPSYEHGNTTAV